MSHSTPARHVGIIGVIAAFLCVAGVMAIITPSAPADVVKPAIVLGPTTVINGVAVVSGTVGAPYSSGQLTLNGQPIALDTGGNFAGSLNLNGQSELNFAVRNPVTGETTVARIPLTTDTVGLGGLVNPQALSALTAAGVSILKPLEGFQLLDGLPLRLQGTVLDKDSLAGLTVNGQDVLGSLGSDRTFSITVPGTTKEITITSTDRYGVSNTTTYPATHSTSAVATPAGPAVNASAAVGVRIAKVRYVTRSVKRTKRFRMVVTIKDSRGFLVRNAVVKVRGVKAGWIVRNPKAKKTNRVGQAAFLLTGRQKAFGKRLWMMTSAQIKTAKASKKTAVKLPKRAKPASARR